MASERQAASPGSAGYSRSRPTLASPVRCLIGLLALALLVTESSRAGPRAAPGATLPPQVRLANQLRSRDLELAAEDALAVGRLLDAARKLEEAARLREDWHLLARAAWVYVDIPALREAERLFREFETRPGYESRRAGLAVVRFLRREWQGALDELRRWQGPTWAPGPLAELLRNGVAVSGESVAWRHALGALYALLNPARGIPLAEQLAAERPKEAAFQLLLGDLYRNLGRRPEARRAWLAYAALEPRGARAFTVRAERLAESGKQPEAADEVLAGLRAHPEDPQLLWAAPLLLETAERLDEAERLLLADCEADRRRWQGRISMHPLQRLTDFCVRHGRLETLARVLRSQVETPAPEMELALAQTLLAQRRPAEAAEVLERMLTRRPEAALPVPGEARFWVWQAHLAAGNRQRAAALIGAGLGDAQQTSGFLLPDRRDYRAFAAWLGSDPQREKDLLEFPSSGEGPAYPRVFWIRLPRQESVSLGQRGPLYEAARRVVMEQIRTRYPDCYPADVELAQVRAAAGDLDGCERALLSAARTKPDWWLPYYFLAVYHHARNRPEDERMAVAEARERAPELPIGPGGFQSVPPHRLAPADMEFRAATDLMLARRYADAIREFEKFRTPPHATAARRALGACLLAQEKLVEAEALWLAAGLRLPLPLPGEPGGAGYPPLGPVAVRNDGGHLADYPLWYVALAAARQFGPAAAELPPGLDRVVEFLLRQSVTLRRDSIALELVLASYLREPNRFIQNALAPTAARLREARSLHEAIVQRDPKNVTALLALGRYEAAAEADPDHYPARARLADYYLQLDDPRAVGELQACKQLQPSAEYLEKLVRLQVRRGSRRLALAEAQEIVRLGTSHRQAHTRLRGHLLTGVLYHESGLPALAAEQYAELTREPEAARMGFGDSPRHLAALAHLEAGDAGAAHPLLEATRQPGAFRKTTHLLLAWLARRRGAEDNYWRHLTAASPQSHEQYGIDDGVHLFSLPRSLAAVLKRFPDCFPARFVLAANGLHTRSYRGLREDEAVTAAREELRKLAAEFPDWSGPVRLLAARSQGDPGGTPPALVADLRRRAAAEAARLNALQAREPALPLRPPLAIEWTADLPVNWPPVSDGKAVFAADYQALYRVSPVNGALLATAHVPPMAHPPAVAGGRLFAVHRQVAAAYDTETLRRLWVQPLDAGGDHTPVATKDVVVFALQGGAVTALRAADGTPAWSAACGAEPAAPPAELGGAVLVATEDGALQALALSDGQLRWKRRLSELPGAAGLDYTARRLRVVGGRVVLLAQARGIMAGSGEWLLACLGPDGNPAWGERVNLGGGPPVCYPIDGGRSLLLSADYSGRAVVLDAATGKQLAVRTLDADNGRSTLIGAAGAWVFARTGRGELALIEASTGAVAWSGEESLAPREALVVGNRVVVLSESMPRLWCLKPVGAQRNVPARTR